VFVLDLETSILWRSGPELSSCATKKKYINSNSISRLNVLLNINVGKSQNNNLVKTLQKVRSIVCFYVTFPYPLHKLRSSTCFVRIT
jgi:hypothetical protein